MSFCFPLALGPSLHPDLSTLPFVSRPIAFSEEAVVVAISGQVGMEM